MRLHGELSDQLWTRIEVISENHARLEYFRELVEILANEAKDLLSGASSVAGMS